MKNLLVIMLIMYFSQNNVFAEEKINTKVIFSGDNSIIYEDNADWLLYKININWTNKTLLEINSKNSESMEKSSENTKIYYELINKQMEVILQQVNADERKNEDEKTTNKIKKFLKNIWDKLLDLTSKSI